MLHSKIFNETQQILYFKPHIDYFARRINTQKLPQYCSRRPDPEAKFIDVLQLIGVPICAIFLLSLACYHVDLHCKSIDWFLYEGNIGMKKVKLPIFTYS